MREILRGSGAIILFLVGSGSGLAVYWHRREVWQQLQTFALLLLFLQRMVEYRSLPVQSILQQATDYPQFFSLHLEHCRSFADLPLPAALSKPLKEELHADLVELSTAPRRAVCTSLQQMYTLCQRECTQAEEKMRCALRICPRLGVCLGILTAILFY